jgi:hypothetical protein
MSQEFKVHDYDIIYLSYDEPNAEENFYDIKQKIPWAKRVHGVEGSDAAHKACANISDTERFITVDGDNKVSHEFISEVLHFSDDKDLSKCVISFSAYNIINGLTYGNGGIKCWPTELVKTMRTHENADPDNTAAGIDFCWGLEYLQINKIHSHVYNNASPWQAWRAGFREGVKMSLLEGKKPDKDKFCTQVPKKNLDRLKIWSTVGEDVKNGIWAIYGAREGVYKTMCTDWDYVNVRDFEYLNKLWREEYSKIREEDLRYEIMGLGYTLREELDLNIPVDHYDTGQSKFFKSVYTPPERAPQTFLSEKEKSEYDIVMISYNEPNAEENYHKLKTRFPRAKRIHGVKGIPKAHQEAAKLCKTDLIWIVDGDADIKDDFNFDYKSPNHEMNYVKVWRSENPVNGLKYGYGGVKLFPRQATIEMDITKPDMTTSISRHFRPMPSVSNITSFNTDAFSAWKSGFRECAKLASSIIDRQKQDETDKRLTAWCQDADESIPFANEAVQGAREGRKYGEKFKNNLEKLNLINDFDWLQQQFKKSYKTEIKPLQTNNDNADEFVKEILDRFEILYPKEKVSNFRRFYSSQELTSLFKLVDNDDLRKAIVEKNLHSIFRLVDVDDDLRKAIVEKNLYSIFRIVETDDDLRKAIVEKNLHSIFRLVNADDDLRKAIVEENLHSIFRLLDNDDLRKAVIDKNMYSLARLLPELEDEMKVVLNNDQYALWRVLENYTGSSLIKPIKTLVNENKNFDKDCISRGQLLSKSWLIDTLKNLNVKLGNIYLCAGWYATIIPLMIEKGIDFNNVRSFDNDPDVWKIAEIFNKELVANGWKFKAQTLDIHKLNYNQFEYQTIKSNGEVETIKDSANTIINTSCEHIENFEEWYAKIPKGKLVVLQSNNYFELDEHINCVKDSLHFAEMAPLSKVLFTGELELEKYTRYMRIGIK